MGWLENEISQDEGFRSKPYFDCCGKPYLKCVCLLDGKKRGKLTIGYGRNLDAIGITPQEGRILRDNDIATAKQCAAFFPWYSELTQPRQDVVTMMLFNVGFESFSGFKKMIEALGKGDFKIAAAEMLASHWADEVGERANRLAAVMASGEYPAPLPSR
jgi:lysozyme